MQRAIIKIEKLDAQEKQVFDVFSSCYTFVSSGEIASCHSKSSILHAFNEEHDNLVNMKYQPPEFMDKYFQLFPKVYGFGSFNSDKYFVMERLPGMTLRNIMKCSGKDVPGSKPVDLLPLFIDLSKDFDYLCKNVLYSRNEWYSRDSFSHGDLKPENMFLSNNKTSPRLRVIDPAPHAATSWVYHPRRILGQTGDVISICFILLEVITKVQILGVRTFMINESDNSSHYSLQQLGTLHADKAGVKDILNFLMRPLRLVGYEHLIEFLQSLKETGFKVMLYVPEDTWNQCTE
eukprot:TRINITY_DN5277_c0_g1_i1.p1 TRINITY_DN5277_c0_g1~~TRINITY_DN5277_c0_g1_i1.p1  ORF type:complete len:291 (-),score=55.15 TRINITY_DN5277_c0_g1_i1:19-891(-)